MKKDENQTTWQFYKEFYKEYKPIIVVAFVFLAVLPICLYILALTPSSIGFMSPEDARTWLTYYGAIAGGGMTLSGVAWTISDQRKKRIIDMKIQYKPIVFFSDSDTKIKGLFVQYEDSCLHRNYILQLKNIGRGEAKAIKIDIKSDVLKECTGSLKYDSYIPIIVSKERISFKIGIPLDFYKKFPKKVNIDLHVDLSYLGYDNDIITGKIDILLYRKTAEKDWSCKIGLPDLTNI